MCERNEEKEEIIELRTAIDNFCEECIECADDSPDLDCPLWPYSFFNKTNRKGDCNV